MMTNERLFLLILWALAIITFALGWKIMDTKHTLQRDLLELKHQIERLHK